jgi:hypothetical protein
VNRLKEAGLGDVVVEKKCIDWGPVDISVVVDLVDVSI